MNGGILAALRGGRNWLPRDSAGRLRPHPNPPGPPMNHPSGTLGRWETSGIGLFLWWIMGRSMRS
jgi:hypothetical protein